MEQTASVLSGDFEGRQKKDNNYLFFSPLGRKFGSVIVEVGQVEVMALPLPRTLRVTVEWGFKGEASLSP